jgi:hypothetical protein
MKNMTKGKYDGFRPGGMMMTFSTAGISAAGFDI